MNEDIEMKGILWDAMLQFFTVRKHIAIIPLGPPLRKHNFRLTHQLVCDLEIKIINKIPQNR